MYLKAIEIQGFKSFPDKTVITFGDEITAIVGPNGSGKSNISDAIRWVMGEMSTKALRGAKMEDVIFGGTAKRPQLGYAEVSLILDNSTSILQYEAPEVMVTRRFYRSGDSEYYINRQSARLKDINELFMDTGLGKEGYSNIGQGRIDEILSAKSADRREIFEEAAGISKYRHRKEETERKLAQTNDNLLRINDKISELELQVAPLQEQSEKAKKYLVYRDELRGLEVAVWLNQLEKLSQRKQKAVEDYTSAKFILDQGKEDLERMYAEVERLSNTLRDIDIEAERLRADITETEAAAAEKRSRGAVLSSRIEGAEHNIAQLQSEIRDQSGRSEELQEQIAEKVRREAEIRTEQAQAGQEEQRLETEAAGCLAALAEREAGRDALREKLELLTRQAGELRIAMESGEESNRNVQDRAAAVRDSLDALRTELQGLDRQEEEAAEEKKAAEDRAQALHNAVAGYTMRMQSRTRSRDEAAGKVSALKVQKDTLASKIRMYEEMERSYEGFSRAIRLVMQESRRGTLRNIHGPVSQLIRVEDDHTVAIETALGAGAQNIVVESEQDGKAAIAFLKRRDGGRATFLPISVIRGRRLAEKGLLEQNGAVGIAADLVRCEDRYREIVENLLGRTLIAEDMDSAIAIAGRYGHRFRIVTLDGQVLQAGGSMTGGSAARSSGVLSRANDLERMRGELKTAEGSLEEQENAWRTVLREIAETEAALNDANLQLRSVEDTLLRLTETETRHAEVRASLTAQIRRAEEEETIVRDLLSGGSGKMDRLRQRVEEIESEHKETEAALKEAEARAEEARGAVRSLQEQRLALQLSAAKLQTEAEELHKSLAEQRQLSEVLHGDRTVREQRISEYTISAEQLRRELEQCRAEEERETEKAEAVRTRLREKMEYRGGIEATKTRTEKETQQKNRDLLDMERECARLEQNRSSAELEEKQILDRLWDGYELTPSTAGDAAAEIQSVTAAQKRIGELRRKMNALGHPNIGAIEEYERVKTRYDFLTGQRDDIETSSRELRGIISDLTGEMTEIFRTEFDKINRFFGETFQEMFGGGKASLELEDPEDILGCGIEIRVQPPGKQLKTIMLLSGGEKSFVAIALYFAIMKVRPTPFCMLDEIDAALDDQNVTRFASYLHNLCGKTQFIVITHRRGTMEAADVLYGVTMQEQGVSKVLSVDLNQITEEMHITN